MKKILLALFILFSAVGNLWADPVTFQATVNSPSVSLDEVVQLTLTVTGINKDLNPISLPVLDGFTAKYMGPSTSVSIINGDYHSEHSFIYDLFPNKVGHFQIPPITATIAGQSYTTKPIDVEVTQTPANPAGGQSSANAPPTAENLKDRVKIQVAVAHTHVYLDQGVPMTVRLLVNGVPLRDIQYPQFDKSGVSVDDFEKPTQQTEIIDGVKYDTVEFKTTIYPNRLGDLDLGPVQIAGNVLYKTGQNNPFAQDNDFFGSDVFNGFFDSYAARPMTISSPPVVLHVSPLPQAGRPSDFSGAIGEFDFQASVSPTQVRAGDPITLKMSVQGSGNFKNMLMPTFQAPGFKTYQPQIKQNGNTKTAEEAIIPTSTNIKQVPALRFTYFDTSTGEYKTITQGPFPIHVSAPSPDQDFKAVGFSDIPKESAPAAQFSWVKMFKDIYGLLVKLFSMLWFQIGLGLLLVAAIAWFFWRRFRQRLENDPAFARRLKAVREARKTLEQAKGTIPSGQAKEFYTLLSKALRDYLANKWHESSPALSINEIISRLKAARLGHGDTEEVKNMLEICDLVCFAGARRDSGQMQKDLTITQDLISRLEKALK